MASSPMKDVWGRGFRLVYAEIEVRARRSQKPETLLWQDIDLAPDFPLLMSFVDRWRAEHDGVLTDLRVATLDDVSPADLDGEYGSLALH